MSNKEQPFNHNHPKVLILGSKTCLKEAAEIGVSKEDIKAMNIIQLGDLAKVMLDRKG